MTVFGKNVVDYKRFIECGSCPWGCPYDNIYWESPPGGYEFIMKFEKIYKVQLLLNLRVIKC